MVPETVNMDPEDDNKHLFLDPETNILGKRKYIYYMKSNKFSKNNFKFGLNF